MADVTLAIPVYNSAPFLDELFACLRSLNPAPAQIVFLNDASMDDSASRLDAIVAEMRKRAPAVVLHNERNLGIAGTYNRLVREAHGEWIQLLDADDLLVERDYFARIQPALTEDNDLVVTALDSDARLLGRISRLLNWLVPNRPPIWWPLLGSFATRAGVLYRRRCLLDIPFPDPAYPGSDVIHLLDLRNRGRCLFLRNPQTFYRIHQNAQSSRVRDYSVYRKELIRFPRAVRWAYGLDLCLRRLGQRWLR